MPNETSNVSTSVQATLPENCISTLPSSRGFKLASLNINKLTTHIDELRVLLSYNEIDVISINETKLNETIQDNDVSISGYSDPVRLDRTTDDGGGVCFYVKESVNFKRRNDLHVDTLESLCIEIHKPGSKPFIVVTWYRPPGSPIAVFSSFEILLGKLDSENVEYFLMGDLNCDMIAETYDNNTRKLVGIADIYGLQQLITEPTRITPTSATLLDLVFTNCPDNIVCSGVRHINISDHSIVFAYRKLSAFSATNGHNTITYRKFSNFNREHFRNEVASQDWEQMYNTTNPNEMWCHWKSVFLSIVEKHAPLRTRRVRARRSPWITSDLKNLMHDRNISKIRACKSKDPNDWRQYKIQRNKVNNDIRSAKQAYYRKSFNEYRGDSRKTWQTINEIISRKSRKIPVTSLNVDGVSITNPDDLSDTFNNHFATIGPKLASEIDNSSCNDPLMYFTGTDKKFELSPINSDQVLILLNKLNKSKAVGLDQISARLIRECADLICNPIRDIFNQSIIQGVFPEDWKSARVTPLFKDGSRDDLNNYRPISVISVIAKVFERIIYDQVYEYLEEHGVLCNSQSGFRATHSTVTALLEATDTWAYNIDHGKINAVVFLDLKKAFDTVDHEILLIKLSHYGIQGNAYRWFKSYLEHRTQRCSVNGALSNTRVLSCGVPQGTILGPLLFLLYINDLPNCFEKSSARMYADDTHLTYAGVRVNDIQSCLNEDLKHVHNWLRANRLTLNMTKTEYMLIGSGQRVGTLPDSPVLTVNGAVINKVSSTKSLGVIIDDRLNWSHHVEKVSKKIASGIGALKRIRHLVPQPILIQIFNALVQPHFDYCCTVWGNCGLTLQEKLFKLQKRAARVLTFSSFDSEYEPLFAILGWKTVTQQQQLHKATMVFKSLHGLTPNYLSSKFENRCSTYTLRDSENKLKVPLPRTDYFKRSFSYSGAALWNSLPIEARKAESLGVFKNIVKQHI